MSAEQQKSSYKIRAFYTGREDKLTSALPFHLYFSLFCIIFLEVDSKIVKIFTNIIDTS